MSAAAIPEPVPSSTLYRSEAREAQVIFRLTFEERAELKRRAQAEGVTMQTYLERVVLGRDDAQDRRLGRPFSKNPDPEQLPLQ